MNGDHDYGPHTGHKLGLWFAVAAVVWIAALAIAVAAIGYLLSQ